MNEQISNLFQAILDGDMPGTKEAVQAALDAGLEPGLILADGMIAAMSPKVNKVQITGCFICTLDIK